MYPYHIKVYISNDQLAARDLIYSSFRFILKNPNFTTVIA
jgi:hypothetical protein